MQLHWSLDDVFLKDAWVTVGVFDGVHLGHQFVLEKLVQGARAAGVPAVVVTFNPHPALVLGRRQSPLYLTTPDEKAALLEALGIDATITLRFDQQLASLSARAFMQMLKTHLGLKHLEVGHDFALGHGREGNVDMLTTLGKELGYSVGISSAINNIDQRISSSHIRNALNDGDVRLAKHMLGRPYTISAEIVHGDGRGRSLGIPTANLDVWAEQIIPRAGVYACRAKVKTGTFSAVANIGTRPTFNTEPVAPRVEAMLLDFDEDLYGQSLQLSFVDRLRNEQRFPSVDALLAQIHQDVQQARQLLAEESNA